MLMSNFHTRNLGSKLSKQKRLKEKKRRVNTQIPTADAPRRQKRSPEQSDGEFLTVSTANNVASSVPTRLVKATVLASRRSVSLS